MLPDRRLKSRIVPFVESVGEASAACLVTMVQGNIFALSVGHWIIASRTGVIAGVIATLAILLAQIRNRWAMGAVLGITTAVVDYLVHPPQFGPAGLEAVVTGLAATALFHLVGMIFGRMRRRAAEPAAAPSE